MDSLVMRVRADAHHRNQKQQEDWRCEQRRRGELVDEVNRSLAEIRTRRAEVSQAKIRAIMAQQRREARESIVFRRMEVYLWTRARTWRALRRARFTTRRRYLSSSLNPREHGRRDVVHTGAVRRSGGVDLREPASFVACGHELLRRGAPSRRGPMCIRKQPHCQSGGRLFDHG